jgi:hypothetical protein
MLQVQFVMLSLPEGEYVKLGHKVQLSAEMSARSLEYLPAEHREHTAVPSESL